MKMKKLLGFGLAICLAGSLPFFATADADRVTADLKSSSQKWEVNDSSVGPIVPFDSEDVELKVETYEKGISVTANPAAQGMPWKFVYATFTLDLDTYPMFVFDVESTDMHYEIKTTKGDKFGVAADEYVLLVGDDPVRNVINLQDFAKLNDDKNKTGDGDETVMLFIAFFPSGEAGAWNGAAKVKELGFLTKEAAAPPTTTAEPTTTKTEDTDKTEAPASSGTTSETEKQDGLPTIAIVGIVAAVVVVVAGVAAFVVIKKKKGGPKA